MFSSPIKWVIMFAPLAFIFMFGAMINKMSASTAQMVFWAFGAVMGLSIAWIFAVFTGDVDRTDLLRDGNRLRRPVDLGLHHQEGPERHGARSCSWA